MTKPSILPSTGMPLRLNGFFTISLRDSWTSMVGVTTKVARVM